MLLIDHIKTKIKSPQQNGICESFHKTIQPTGWCRGEYYALAFRKKLYFTSNKLRKDLDTWFGDYNRNRTHQVNYCFEKTPCQTFVAAAKLAWEKRIEPIFLFTQQKALLHCSCKPALPE